MSRRITEYDGTIRNVLRLTGENDTYCDLVCVNGMLMIGTKDGLVSLSPRKENEEKKVWVSNAGGTVMSGDLLMASTVDGYLQKQDSLIVCSTTVGKVEQVCDFIQEKVSKKKILVDDDGTPILNKKGETIMVYSDAREDKWDMQFLPNGKKAILLKWTPLWG